MIRNVLQPPPLPLDMHKIQAHAQSNPQSWRSGQSSPTPSNATLGSLSWFAERSATELIPLLKEAYSALREKERDLFLAAEIGKSLLENNITLKTKYEGLLQQLQLFREAQSRPRITSGTGDKFVPSVDGIPGINIQDDDDDDNDPHRVREISFDDDNDSLTSSGGGGGPRYSTAGIKARQRTLSTSRAQQVATIEIEKLEKENMELQTRLQLALGEADEREKQTRQKQKLLEKELEALKTELGGATQKVEELEEEKEKLVEVKKSLLVENGPRGGRLSPNREATGQESDDPIISQLLEKLQGLEQTNENLSKTKSNLEQKLTATLRDLSSLKQEFETCEFTQDDYRSLQDAYQRQFKHIAELNESLEEHRNMLVSVREKQQLRGGGGSGSSSGRGRRHHSHETDIEDSEVLRDSLGSRYSRGRSASARSLSPSPLTMSGSRHSRRDSVSSWSTVLSEAADMMEGLMGMAGTKKGRTPPKTLLSELEDKWFKEAGISNQESPVLDIHEAFGEKTSATTTGSNASNNSSSHADCAPLQNSGIAANSTPEPPTPSKSFTQLLTSPGELALDTLLSRTGFDRSFLDECFEFIHEAQSVGLFDEEFYPSSDIDSMEDRMGMMGMVATKDSSEIAERKGLVGWVVRLLRRVFRAVWRWCRFLGVLVAAVVISVMRGPDEIMVEYGEEW